MEEIIARREFEEAWDKGMADWNSGEGSLVGKVDDCQSMDNRELEEKQSNNAIGGSQLEGFQ